MSARCRHIEKSQEAYCQAAGSDEIVTAEVLLCSWADAHPERIMDAPRWLSRQALAGYPVQEARDCIGCPGYLADANSRKDTP